MREKKVSGFRNREGIEKKLQINNRKKRRGERLSRIVARGESHLSFAYWTAASFFFLHQNLKSVNKQAKWPTKSHTRLW